MFRQRSDTEKFLFNVSPKTVVFSVQLIFLFCICNLFDDTVSSSDYIASSL
jgi:hypothetical protein